VAGTPRLRAGPGRVRWRDAGGGELKHEQSSAAASSGDGSRSGWRGWFTSTGAPANWGLVRYLLAGLVAGGALSGGLPEVRGTLLAALAGAVVVASMGRLPSLAAGARRAGTSVPLRRR
jgi:hypothetical protein